jgi:hypothetical protein
MCSDAMSFRVAPSHPTPQNRGEIVDTAYSPGSVAPD